MSNVEQARAAKRRRVFLDLWKQYGDGGAAPTSRDDCETWLLTVIHRLREEVSAETSPSSDASMELLSARYGKRLDLHLCWQLLANSLALPDTRLRPVTRHGILTSLQNALQFEEWPTATPEISPSSGASERCAILLSRQEARLLADALAALDAGEVQDVVMPVSSGKHGDAWTWNQYRLRALQHVHFLCGRGVAKTTARRRVADAIGQSEESLRRWEKPSSELHLRVAAEAERGLGAQVNLKFDLAVAEAAGKACRANEIAAAELEAEPLDMFGPRYRAAFGVVKEPESGRSRWASARRRTGRKSLKSRP